MSKFTFTTLKTILVALVLTLSTNQLFAQTNNGIFFQAVARDNFSNPAKDRKIYVQSSIIQTTPTGTKVLTEEHQANTDAMGVFSISLGNGVRVGGTAGSLTTIDWSKGPFFLNLKVAITPIGGNSNWDYNKEWVDMGTTSFGAVPFALYSASSAKVDDKLNVSDTTTMLKVYAKAMSVQSLETAVASKLTAADTLTMLKPYAKAAYTIDSNFFRAQLATKLSIGDTILYTKQKYTDSTIAKKLNIADSTLYVTKSQLASYNFSSSGTTTTTSVTMDTTSLSNRINLKANTSDLTALNTSVSSNTASITAHTSSINSLTNNITTNTASITVNTAAIELEAATARAAELLLTNHIASNSTSITAINTILSAATSSNTANTLVTRDASGNLSAGSITASNYASTPISLTYTGSTINWNPTVGANAAITLTQNSTLSFSSTPLVGSYGTIVLTQDGTGGRTITLPTISNVTNKVLGSASNTTVSLSTAANAKDILNFYYDGTNCYWNIGQGYGTAATASFTLTTTGTGAATLSGTTLNIPSVSSTVNSGSISGTIAVANGGTGASTLTGYVKGTGTTAMTASSNIPVADVTGAAPLASPTFTGTVTTSTINTGALSATSVNTPIYASTPQSLTSGSTISWNPTLGLNANVTLDQNSTLNFSSTPPSGSYGTLVITQDATGGRSITLPSTTNKILGSTSTTSIALSTAAGAKDILNFYYDGTNCFWNIGQGYGTAATSASTNLATSVSGTLPVANGGTGATTLTGLIKGTGTTAFTAAVAGTDYLSPNGSAANLTNFPTFNQNTTGNAATVTTNANLNGDVTSVGNASTVVKINGTSLASLSTGILKNTTSTGVPAIAVAGTDYQAPITLTTTGTGAATLSGTTLNIPAVSSTVNAGSISGTISVTNGGTGATTLTGLVKGTGTSALTAAVAGSDYQAPITLTTTGSGSATLSGTTINIPNSVPYSGANAAVDLGAYNLTVNGLTIGQGKSTGTGDNTAVGYQVLNNNSGSKNTGVGSYAANANTSGHDNVGVGYYALKLNLTGNYNTAIGANAAFSANTSNSNYITAVGYYALRDENNTGNTALGAFAGKPASSQYYSKTTNSTFLGYNTTTSKTDPSGSEIPIDNATAIGYGAAVTASNLIQLGNTSVTNVKTSGTVTAGDITYPKTHGTANQVLTTTGSGTLTFTTPTVAKPTSDQFTATAAQTSFTLTQTPITNTTVSPNVKPNVWMYINGIRTNNSAYSISGTTVTYTAASNNNYTIVVGDRIQFDYAY
jgi:hypothetical protein